MFNTFFFFFSSRRRHTRLTCDWSSDVCSSDLLDDALLIAAAPGGVGQDDAAGVIGEQPRVGEGDVPAEAAAEHDRLVQPERVTQPPQVIGPAPHVPELGTAVIAAAVAPQVEVQ